MKFEKHLINFAYEFKTGWGHLKVDGLFIFAKRSQVKHAIAGQSTYLDLVRCSDFVSHAFIPVSQRVEIQSSE